MIVGGGTNQNNQNQEKLSSTLRIGSAKKIEQKANIEKKNMMESITTRMETIGGSENNSEILNDSSYNFSANKRQSRAMFHNFQIAQTVVEIVEKLELLQQLSSGLSNLELLLKLKCLILKVKPKIKINNKKIKKNYK